MSTTKPVLTSDEIEFLDHSNRIEDERSKEAMEDAINAWKYAKTIEVMTVPDLLEIHRLLLHRIAPHIAGVFREHDIRIGGKTKRFIGKDLLKGQVENVLVDLNKGEEFGLAAQRAGYARKIHVAYENVHPFPDGNGRSGRILYNWQRVRMGLPVHVIHEGEEQMAYYDWFQD